MLFLVATRLGFAKRFRKSSLDIWQCAHFGLEREPDTLVTGESGKKSSGASYES